MNSKSLTIPNPVIKKLGVITRFVPFVENYLKYKPSRTKVMLVNGQILCLLPDKHFNHAVVSRARTTNNQHERRTTDKHIHGTYWSEKDSAPSNCDSKAPTTQTSETTTIRRLKSDICHQTSEIRHLSSDV